MHPNTATFRKLQFLVWKDLTPSDPRHDRIAERLPVFVRPRTPVCETYYEEGCRCALGHAPCCFCTDMSEGEADAYCGGGMRALIEYRRKCEDEGTQP